MARTKNTARIQNLGLPRALGAARKPIKIRKPTYLEPWKKDCADKAVRQGRVVAAPPSVRGCTSSRGGEGIRSLSSVTFIRSFVESLVHCACVSSELESEQTITFPPDPVHPPTSGEGTPVNPEIDATNVMLVQVTNAGMARTIVTEKKVKEAKRKAEQSDTSIKAAQRTRIAGAEA